MPAFTAFDTKQSSHMDMTMHPVTGIVEITIQFHPNNTGPYNCRVYELPPPWTGKPVLKREWRQGQPGMLGAFGYGASLLLPNGALLVGVPLGIDNSDNVTPTLLIEPDYGTPYPLGGQGGSAELQEIVEIHAKTISRIETILIAQQQQIDALKTALANVGMGDYPAGDRELVKRLREFMLPLLGA